MRFGSVFSGIGGFDLALERAGHEPVWQIENDRDCNRVLAAHWPEVARYGDVAAVTVRTLEALGPVELICGGFPCQDLSVAGKRAGLSGSRSGLFYEFIRLARDLRPRWLLVENVPGLLSSNGGRDMASVVGALEELGYGWAYRTLDAQYFGVPQRRRRIFIVGCLGDGDRAAEVLFEPESGLGHPPPGRPTREGASPVPEDGARRGRGRRTGVGGEKWPQPVAGTLDADFARKQGQNNQGANGKFFVPSVTPPLLASGDNGYDMDGTGRGTPIIPMIARPLRAQALASHREDSDTYVSTGLIADSPDVANALSTSYAKTADHAGKNGTGPCNVIVTPAPIAAPLTAGGHPGSNEPDRHGEDDQNLVAFAAQQTPKGFSHDIAPTLQVPSPTGGGQPHAVAIQTGGDYNGDPKAAVRRLTPLECERLQGFPDGWTEGLADSPRYRMLGNAVAVPVVEWIGRRFPR